MQCQDCPLKSLVHQGDQQGFYCQVNRLSITPMGAPAEAEAHLVRDCQFADFHAAVKGHLPKLKAQVLTGLAKLRRALADQEDRLASVELLEAQLNEPTGGD